MDYEEEKRREEKERKKADVRRRLEEQASANRVKKGFMTPDRKKKLRNLLRQKATEELRLEQNRKAEERKRIIAERTGEPKHINNPNEATLQVVCKEYHDRIAGLHDDKYDLEGEVKYREILINHLTTQVNDSRGKFKKPNLKKVSKYEAKLEKMRQAAEKAAVDFRANLKSVKSGIFQFNDDKDEDKPQPEWTK